MSYRLILSVQSFLKWKGFEPVPIDGREGPLTSAAWNKFLDSEEDKVNPPAIATPAPLQDRFHAFIPFILARECAYAKGSKEKIPEDVVAENIPGDNGGWTKYGIDQSSHPSVNVRYLTSEQACAIYLDEWIAHKCDSLPSPFSEIVFDSFVTGGKPIQWLQEALGIAQDGHIGPQTISAANACPNKKAAGEKMISLRDDYFRGLAEKYPNDRKFEQGWLNRDSELRKFISDKLRIA
jgi:lysozyme family protein